MNYKIQGAIEKNKKNFIIFIILWIIITIVFVMPVSYAITNATVDGIFNMNKFFDEIGQAMSNMGTSIGSAFTAGYFGGFVSLFWKYTLVYLVLVIIGLFRTAPKNEFTDIEHGSSDWCEGGEQYRVLSKNKGILLAENNYLPLDKRGNVNVLVVGRIGITENQHHIQFLMHIKC